MERPRKLPVQLWLLQKIEGARYLSELQEAGNLILDLLFPKIEDPGRLETELEMTPGVVCAGLFVGRADVVVVATQQGIVTIDRPGARP